MEIKNAPSALIGSVVDFTATLWDEKGKLSPTDDYNFIWKDNAEPRHSGVSNINMFVLSVDNNISDHLLTYPGELDIGLRKAKKDKEAKVH